MSDSSKEPAVREGRDSVVRPSPFSSRASRMAMTVCVFLSPVAASENTMLSCQANMTDMPPEEESPRISEIMPQPDKAVGIQRQLQDLPTQSPPSYCVRPTERSRCEEGFLFGGGTCRSIVCYNNDLLCSNDPIEKDLFEVGCWFFEGFSFFQNCDCPPPYTCLPADSLRERPADCYNGNGITITEPARGRCEAGGCCTPDKPLCDLESEMHMMSLGYGILTEDDGCASSLDYFGGNHGCTWHSDGNSNEVLICDNVGSVTTDEEELEDHNFCHITFAGTNDINDILTYFGQVFSPLFRRKASFGTGENKVSFTGVGALMEYGFQSESDDTDGIVEIAFREAEKKGCFTREGAAISLFGHSLGGAMADYLALMIGGLYPEVYVKLRTLNAPAPLVKRLRGKARKLPVWKRKIQYINGLVMPRGPVFNNAFLVPRPYGPYQDYDPVSQMLPGGYYATRRKIRFLCEALNKDGDKLSYFVAGKKGCAFGRTDVLNEMPTFPHPGGLVRNDELNLDEAINDLLTTLAQFGITIDERIIEAANIVATIADVNFQDNFWLVLDLHMMRRSLHFSNILTEDGAQCSKKRHSIKLVPSPAAP